MTIASFTNSQEGLFYTFYSAWLYADSSTPANQRPSGEWNNKEAKLKLVEGKLMPLSKMLGNQAETQLWALEMVPKGFWCDDKAYPSKKQRLHMTKQQQKPNEKHITIFN